MRPFLLAALATISALAPATAHAWGGTAHAVIDRAAIEAIPDDGPVFLRKYADYVAASASLPDSWRGASENFSKIDEDPNHGWFREQFTFVTPIPRSRYEFVLALYKHYEKIRDSDPETAQRTNVRWTGTLPYAAIEAYDRLVVCMRYVRKAQAEGRDASVPEQHCAFQTIRLGHYIGDGSQPLHDSIHSDGWRGDNPKGYTRDRSIHGRFESGFVDAIGLTVKDIAPRIGAPAHLSGDMFDAVLGFLDDAGDRMETVYELEKRDGFANHADKDVREMVYAQTAKGAAMLRDMICRAWAESASPPATVDPSPLDPANPAYNPETGSAPD
ncbi:nuclease [Sphingomonas sp. LaA6.9]|uniref:nuclease n=1 Tax=Sphingomonas sp. LaA6.9 TaxID=2919914 RepID=UPI001F4F448B|nr:nuclease [Sphingomonas sp. LaA6.9]MCJ8155907.1 nuclease [Sphingomonas sp. LaA6.9]